MFLDRVIHFGENLVDEIKYRSPKKLKSLIEVNYVVHVKVHVLSFNMILISSALRVPRLSYLFRGTFGRSGKGLFAEKSKTVNRISICIARESTCSKLQYDYDLICVSCF